MFGDWQEALQAEGLPLNPTSTEQEAAAARVTARHADSKEDLVLLLDAIGLPGGDDTLTALLPLVNSSEGDPDMPEQTPQTSNAFEAMALSMFYADHSMEEITEATGLSEDEITALVAAQQRKADAGETDDTITADPSVDDSVEQLLAWAEAHPTAGIRNKAARVRGDLSELTARRAADDAQREAEERVAKLTAELEKAKEDLRAAKAGTHSAPAAATAAPTPIRPGIGSGRSREELARIRTWARANGHQVADAGMIRKVVLEAYDAAHQAPTAKAS
ncbi:histone-like nucleoid-structuring protein Lsr2 [Streptomyces sp. NPDC014991]|uniref:Lsr2 family DNA-binding protein n=1 Tax=Streptomyces sp. NPDC014991 TaxID=3364935 RepID=UPI0036F6DE3B